MSQLNGKIIAILATNGFEQSELMEPKKALEDAGAKTQVISLESGEIKGWKDKNWGDSVKVDAVVGDVSASDFDGLVLPGGQMNPDILRADKKAVSFVRDFFEQHKPVGAICHGPWLLVEADVLDGRNVTSYHSIQTDVKNAGANRTLTGAVFNFLCFFSKLRLDACPNVLYISSSLLMIGFILITDARASSLVAKAPRLHRGYRGFESLLAQR